MAVPVISSISPARGTSKGAELVKISGAGFAENVSVLFGATPAEVIIVRDEGDLSVADIKTPAQAPSLVAVTLINLDSSGVPIPGEQFTLPGAYEYRRSELVRESDLTRLVRTLLRTIRAQLVDNTSITVSVDYDDTTVDGLNVVAISKLPSLVLSGPNVGENRFYST
ncbi:MAG: IPT/TIG domain-containing protein, partial [Deltaproteobacteria bacterium]|nr:IPT/TIG domain-containing protein [Deltaproteobacteria bacterium]